MMIALIMNIQKVTAPPNVLRKNGVNCVMATTPIHKTNVARDIAMPRILVGKISDIKTQGMGPNETAKLAI